LKRKGDELPAWVPTNVHRECDELERAYHEGRATAEQLRRARERALAAEL
jgi:hypothetical protein